MAFGDGPLRRRLDQFDAIGEEAKRDLAALCGAPRAVAKGERLREANGPAHEFWIVQEGWLFDSAHTEEGGRQVFTIYQAGDVVGLQDLGWDVAVCDVTAATPASVVRLEKDGFRELINRYPPLGGFFLTYGIYDHTRLLDRLRVIGRMEAVKRVAHLLMQIWSEQVEPDKLPPSGSFSLPLDQSILGDAVSLTNISVSRMMGELENRGLIARQGRRVQVPDTAALSRLAEFTERRREVPLSWVMRSA